MFCFVYDLHGTCLVFVSGKLVHVHVLGCRGGGLYVICAKSVAVTLLCACTVLFVWALVALFLLAAAS